MYFDLPSGKIIQKLFEFLPVIEFFIKIFESLNKYIRKVDFSESFYSFIKWQKLFE